MMEDIVTDQNRQSGVIQLSGNEAIFTNPDSDEGRFQNLLLNMLSGLEWKHLSEEEKELCRRHGYDGERKS